MKTLHPLLFLIFVSGIALNSCRKKEEKADPRDMLIGRYVGKDSSMSTNTAHPYGQPSYLINADSSVKEIEITVSKGANDTIHLIYSKSTAFPSSFVYKGYSYYFGLSLGAESQTTRGLQFSQDATSLSIRDTTIGTTYYGDPDRPDISRHYGRSHIHAVKQ